MLSTQLHFISKREIHRQTYPILKSGSRLFIFWPLVSLFGVPPGILRKGVLTVAQIRRSRQWCSYEVPESPRLQWSLLPSPKRLGTPRTPRGDWLPPVFAPLWRKTDPPVVEASLMDHVPGCAPICVCPLETHQPHPKESPNNETPRQLLQGGAWPF